MDKAQVNAVVRKAVISVLRKGYGKAVVPAAVSNRHIHLSRQDVERLFGAGHQLKQMRPLSQPGQFACEEVLTVVGPKGKLEKVRVLGPERPDTQVELSVTDCFKVGVKPVVRMSGELDNTTGIKLIGPAGETVTQKGAIVAARHIHMSAQEAEDYGLKNGDVISLRKGGERPIILENVLARCGKGHSLEVHLDTDEANAALIKNGDLLEIV